MAYKFSLIRFVPDSARGEFVNIGAIAGDDDTGDWDVRWISNYQRARALDLNGLLPAAKAFTGELDERVMELDRLPVEEEPFSSAVLERLSVDMNNVVHVSAPAPVVAESAEAALDLVFDRLIVDPARTTFRFRKKHQAQAAARRAYQAHDVPVSAVSFQPRVVADAFDFKFDFAVHNGSAVQLVQCWSFELPNQSELAEQVKAWAWMVYSVREHGGRLALDDEALDVPRDLDIECVYVPPVEATSPAWEEARAAFTDLTVTGVTSDDADSVGAKAAELLGAAHH